MYDDIPLDLKNILEPRLSLFYFEKHDFRFKSLTFDDIENIDFNIFSSQKYIIFLLDRNLKHLKSVDKLRTLLSKTLVFTNLDLLKIFGTPERYFYFNPILDEKIFFLLNTSSRQIASQIYDFNVEYSSSDLNNIDKIIINLFNLETSQEEKLFLDVVKFLACGCNVFIQNENILNLFSEDIRIFLNSQMSENDKLEAQFQMHKNYSYVVQINKLEEQLYGIFGHVNDLMEE